MNATRLTLGLCLLGLLGHSEARVARYVENPSIDADEIALGYPVPQARDQAEPFAGFRSLNGLQTRAADLALRSDGPSISLVGQSPGGRPIDMLCFGPEEPMQVLQTGGIHAREWAAPEAVMGIAEALTLGRDQPLIAWVGDQVPVCLIPVLNPDGYSQTLANFALVRVCEAPEDGNPPANCNAADASPRDGRMRRKNLRDSDGDFSSSDDALLGVDLNRNVGPFWATTGRSSNNPASIVYHGPARASEGEMQLLENLVNAVERDQMRLYIDTHSFSRLYFWNCTGRRALDQTAQQWVQRFRLAARAPYANVPTGNPDTGQGCGEFGIGATDELFGYELNIPAYTLELEPACGAGQSDCGASAYGGFGVSHDGFILPERIVPLMRQDAVQMGILAYSMAAGPAWLESVQLRVAGSEALIYQGQWAPAGNGRELQTGSEVAAAPGQSVVLQLRFDRPMRWLDEGTVDLYPGQSQALSPALTLHSGNRSWTLDSDSGRWSQSQGNYPTQIFELQTTLPADWNGQDPLRLDVATADNATLPIDSNPATVPNWRAGQYLGVEAGPDRNHQLAGSTDPTTTPPPPAGGQGGSGAGNVVALLLLLLGSRRWRAIVRAARTHATHS